MESIPIRTYHLLCKVASVIYWPMVMSPPVASQCIVMCSSINIDRTIIGDWLPYDMDYPHLLTVGITGTITVLRRLVHYTQDDDVKLLSWVRAHKMTNMHFNRRVSPYTLDVQKCKDCPFVSDLLLLLSTQYKYELANTIKRAILSWHGIVVGNKTIFYSTPLAIYEMIESHGLH